MTNRQEFKRPVQVLHFETDVSAFVQASPYDTAHDLLTYTQVFGQNGLQKLDKLSPSEKDLVIEVALFNLATRFQLLGLQIDTTKLFHQILYYKRVGELIWSMFIVWLII